MSDYKEMCLVEGEVTFSVRVSTLVPANMVDDEEAVKERLKDVAFDKIENIEVEDVECDNEVFVSISEDTAEKFQYVSIGNYEWNKIVDEVMTTMK